MELTDYELSQLKMMKKFGAAISSAKVEDREEALQKLVMAGLATVTRNDAGQIKYALTQEGRNYLEHLDSESEKKQPKK